MPVSSTNKVTNEGVILGRYLFYDTLLSAGKNMSCASCHKQVYAFSDSPHKFSKGNQQTLTKRNTLPLFNLAWYSAFFWDGKAKSIEQQIFHPVRDTNEMNLPWKQAVQRVANSKFYKPKFRAAFGHQTIDSVLISNAIAQFLKTMLSYQSKFDRVLAGTDTLTKDEYAGLVLINDMTKGDCLHCHTTDADALGTTRTFSNNGLDTIYNSQNYIDKGLGGVTNNPKDNGKFKIPSLRNLVFTAPYMHDGRFATLEDVVDFYSHGVNLSANIDTKMGFAHQKGVNLTSAEKQKIIAFLKTLSDTTFVTNPAFSNPFLDK